MWVDTDYDNEAAKYTYASAGGEPSAEPTLVYGWPGSLTGAESGGNHNSVVGRKTLAAGLRRSPALVCGGWVASVGGGRVRAASVGRDPGAQPTGVLGDFLLPICAQMAGGLVDLDDAARDIRG
jgi:hypothetical protein